MIKIVIFDDHRERSEAISLLISFQSNMQCIGIYEDCSDLAQNLASEVPNVVLMDVHMPGVTGLEGVKLLKKYFPETLIIMQTVFEDDDNLFDALVAGAHSYILKKTTNSKLIEEIITVYNGGASITPEIANRALNYFHKSVANNEENAPALSNSEEILLTQFSKGYSIMQIAGDLSVEVSEINFLIRNIYQKMHRSNQHSL
ncbi:response regulator transcription factor [Mucilaginibacter aquaedulcis]|uniref:response regulator transcription factor n=1 Tax=Mucilaginibacter aquaedulcis TaxID=1187081 RepID=UPI0025B45CE6|nr:response regulator transcription factor [Mucilaginibacter aquaedulcis]MDN3550026.1 response regulator transcription factor [Mucilaginibacter aquaedulcis]